MDFSSVLITIGSSTNFSSPRKKESESLDITIIKTDFFLIIHF